LNDGVSLFETNAPPGTLFYDSDWFIIGPPTQGIYGILTFSAGVQFPAEGLFLPASVMTWSIQYQGLNSGEVGGVRIFSPPVIGSDTPYFWSNSGYEWYTSSKTGSSGDFNALFQATEVPEPTSLKMLIFGAILLRIAGFIPLKFSCR
jgi:hypothetical protein